MLCHGHIQLELVNLLHTEMEQFLQFPTISYLHRLDKISPIFTTSELVLK